MPQGKGTYGTKRGRPPMKAKKTKELKKTKAKPLVKKPMKKKCNGNCK